MIWNPFRRRVHECCEVSTIAIGGPVGSDTYGTLRYDTTYVEFIGVIVDPDVPEDVYGHALEAAQTALREALQENQ